MKYLIRLNGAIVGTYEGRSEAAALNAVAVEEGYKDFEDACTKTDRVRDNYTVSKVEE